MRSYLFRLWMVAGFFIAAAGGVVIAQSLPETVDSSNRQAVVESPDSFTTFGPYKGPISRGVDTTTLSNKVMCGYQGWFGAPGDGSLGSAWRHWVKHPGQFEDGNAKVDLWPDISELDPNERFQTGFKMADGRTG